MRHNMVVVWTKLPWHEDPILKVVVSQFVLLRCMVVAKIEKL